MLQLTHLFFTAPRADPKIFQSLLARLNVIVKNRLNDPQSVFSEAIEKGLYGDHPRHQALTSSYLDKIQLEKAFQVYQDRFADAGDFTFAFVGSFKIDELKPLVETYLASLPNLNRVESGKNVGDERAQGNVNVTVIKGLEEKSTVRVTYHGKAPWSPAARFALQSTIDILKIRLREVLREDKGGVYGVGVYGGLSRWPEGSFSNSITFGCAPDKVDELISTAMAEVEELKAEGPSDDNLGKIKEAHLRSYERGLKENGFWIGNLMNSLQNDLDPNRILSYPDRVEALTKETIQNAAKQYFDQTNLFKAVLLPEEKEE